MQRVLTVGQMRAADGYTINTLGVPSKELMRRAGEGIAEEVKKIAAPHKKILVVCGTGNNGGDGYVCAQTLKNCGCNVEVFAAEGRLSPDCEREKSAYTGKISNVIAGDFDIIVDCLFGTGLAREVTGGYAQIINSVNNSGATVVAADIPSGLNGDSGLAEGCAVKADVTVAVAELKTGYFLNDGPDFCGKVVVKDIGITAPNAGYAQIYEDRDIGALYPARRRNSHKGSYGTAQIIAGSGRYTGAAALASGAALKSGCGYVKLFTPEPVRLALAAKIPQVIFTEIPDFTANAIAVGPGCGVSEDLYNTITRLVRDYRGKLFIDADGLNALSKYGVDILKEGGCEITLTPHIKEFSALSGLPVGEIIKNPIKAAVEFARGNKVNILLKSSVSVLTDGERVALLHRGNSALSKGGSGDMLTGYACGTAARGLSGFDAVAASSYVLGMTAELCSAERTEYCVTAKDLLKNLHNAVLRLTR